MAVAGVALGVMSIVAVHMISAQLVKRMDNLIPQRMAGYAFTASRDLLQARDYFALRKQWRAGELSDITGMAPFIHEHVNISGSKLALVGVDLFAAADLLTGSDSSDVSVGSIVWNGVWLADESTVAVSDDGLALDTETIRHAQHELLGDLPVNGYLPIPPGTVVADIGTAQKLLGWRADRLSYVGLKLQNSGELFFDYLELLAPGFGAGIPTVRGPEITGWRVQSLMQQHPTSQFGKSVLFNVSALGLLALVVAWFLIYQVAVAWLRRLWGVFTRLHVLGVSYARLRLYFLGLLSGLGVVAAVLGIYTGAALATWLLNIVVPGGALPALDSWVVLKGIASALGVCVLGGWWAFYTHGRHAQKSRGSNKGVFLTLICLSALIPGVVFEESGLVGAFLSIAALALLVVVVIPQVLHRLRACSKYVGGGLLWRLSVRGVLWHPQDLSVALSGLTLAVATAIGVGVMVDSFRTDFANMLDRRLSYGTSVSGPAHALHNFSAVLEQSPGVTRWQTYHQLSTRVSDHPVNVVLAGIDAQEAARYGLDRALGVNEILLGEQLAQKLGVGVGDAVAVLGQSYSVADVFQGFGDVIPRIVMHGPVADSILTEVRFNGMPAPDGLAELVRMHPELTFRAQDQVRDVALRVFDQTFAITSLLIAIAIMVAGIGVYVAVTVMRLNQSTSTKLLVTMGVLPREKMVMDFYRGLGIGGVAGVLAIPVGLGMGWILCAVVNPRAFGWSVDMLIAPLALLQPLGWGVLAAALAVLIRVGADEEGELLGS